VTGSRALPALSRVCDKASFWRCTTAVLATVALALLVAALVARPSPDFSERPVIALLHDGGQHELWAIRLARGAHQIAVDSVAPPPVPAGHVYQLWLELPGTGALRPLGLLPQAGPKVIAETPANTRLLTGPGELIVTLEAKGGSQHPGPTGPVLFRGKLDRSG
jgi:anti-sigma-K factor RskA